MEKKKKNLIAIGLSDILADKILQKGLSKTNLSKISYKKLLEFFTEEETTEISKKLKRKPIHSEFINKFIDECDWKCAICNDIKKIQPVIIHHIIPYSKSQNNNYDNLILLCIKHHEDAHSRSDLSGQLLPSKLLKSKKKEWIEYVKCYKKQFQEERTAILHYSTDITMIDPKNIKEDFYRVNFKDILTFESSEHLLDDYSKWEVVREKQSCFFEEILKNQNITKNFFIFSIHRIPLIIHLGYLFGDAFPIEIFHFKRNKKSWHWIVAENLTSEDILNLNDSRIMIPQRSNDFILLLELSGVIQDTDYLIHIPNPCGILKISAGNPNRLWLKYKEQLEQFKEILYKGFAQIQRQNSNAKKIHIFYAGPPPPAFIIGQVLKSLKTDFPESYLYNFNSEITPRYTMVLKI